MILLMDCGLESNPAAPDKEKFLLEAASTNFRPSSSSRELWH